MRQTLAFNFFLVAIILFLVSCTNTPKKNESLTEENHEPDVEKKENCDDVHWSHHKGEDGPENWKNLCDGFTACGGEAQSPIDIITDEATEDTSLSAIIVGYNSTKVNIINNGHTVQFNNTGDNSITIGGKEYQLLQFHYHAKSEHKIDGNHFPVEVHFVHKHSDSDYAVLGIMFEEGEENELFAKYLSNFPIDMGKYETDDMIELKKLLPVDMSYYYYSGSLTTPPCSEIVSWYVVRTPLKASKEQIEKFSKILHDNYRPVMPLNDRKVFTFIK